MGLKIPGQITASYCEGTIVSFAEFQCASSLLPVILTTS